MLHAIGARKARLSDFRGAGLRVPLEDIVTSSVFGTLSLLRVEDQRIALHLLFETIGLPTPVWTGKPSILLWPQRPILARGFQGRSVEPDVEISDGTGATLLIEVKWGAALGEMELSRQWLSLPPATRTLNRHLLLVLEPEAYSATIEEERAIVRKRTRADWPLHVCSWRNVAQGCRMLAADVRLEQSIRSWAQQVQMFLQREDPKSLRGWNNLSLFGVASSDWDFAEGWFPRADPIGALEWEFRTDE